MKKTVHTIKNITIKSLRDFILDSQVTENDSISLNQVDFDNLAVEYRSAYREGIVVPYYLISVWIKEDLTRSVPQCRIALIKDDESRYENDYQGEERPMPEDDIDLETVYRCGWCGNVVDADGSEFDSGEREAKIRLLQKYSERVNTTRVNGACCPNGHDS